MHHRDDLASRVRDLLVQLFELDPAALPTRLDTELVEKWDSLGHMALIERLEQDFAVSFSHSETIRMLSETAVVAELAAKLAAKA
ncbi:MAG: hypothetical protein H7841_00280 [Magnetospirillum sp. WYHS-4]